MQKSVRLISQFKGIMKFIGMFPEVLAPHHTGVFLIPSDFIFARNSNSCPFIHTDIGANLADGMFQGVYNNSQKHPNDLNTVLDRSWQRGLDKIIITVGTINDIPETVKIAEQDGTFRRKNQSIMLISRTLTINVAAIFIDRLYFTMGCHPTRCGEFVSDPDAYYSKLCDAIETHRRKVVAIGECGLDYDRLHFCDAATQKTYFERQLELIQRFKLPLFLHCRNAFGDFYDILARNASKITAGGVVHSFDGTLEQALKFIELGYYIGLNGCSLKTEEQLKVVAQIPNERILLETDCPWCGIRSSHAGKQFDVNSSTFFRYLIVFQ